jgi:hypothetical protein
MTDDDLLTEIRGRLEPARMTVPLDTVVNRGHARRRRRILAAAEVAVGVAAVAAITVAALPSPVTGTTTDQLAAWSVTTRADNVVRVELHSIRDLPQLQAALRARIAPESFKIPPGKGINAIGGWATRLPALESGFAAPLGSPKLRDDDLIYDIWPDQIPPGFALEMILSPVAEPHGQTAVEEGDQLVTPSGQCMPGWRE